MASISSSIFFSQILLAANDSAKELAPNLTFKDWITIFTSIGLPLGGGIAWISNFYKQQTEALEKQYAASAQNLKEAYVINEKRLESLANKQETEIKQLREKIQRLREIYSIKFLDPDKSKTAFELLTINLNHIQEQVEDDKIRSILDKLKSYCEDQVGSLLEQREVEKEAEEWLSRKQNHLVLDSVNHCLEKQYSLEDIFNNQNNQAKKLGENIKSYIRFLIISMQRGTLLPLENEKLPHNQKSYHPTEDKTIFIDALKCIGKKASYELPIETSMEVNDMIQGIIEYIKKIR